MVVLLCKSRNVQDLVHLPKFFAISSTMKKKYGKIFIRPIYSPLCLFKIIGSYGRYTYYGLL